MAKADRNIDNLTNQLCAHEKALISKIDFNQHALCAGKAKFNKAKTKPKKGLICNYCKAPGHKVGHCSKWKTDGRPP